MSPVFRGKAGNAVARGLVHLLSIDRVNDLYDRHIDMKGPDLLLPSCRMSALNIG